MLITFNTKQRDTEFIYHIDILKIIGNNNKEYSYLYLNNYVNNKNENKKGELTVKQSRTCAIYKI
jgi:hypothetical protein